MSQPAALTQAPAPDQIGVPLHASQSGVNGEREFHPATFGAKGDGITNDRSALAALFDASRIHTSDAGNTAVVTFPPGTFLLGDGPPLAIPSHTIVRGSGAATVLRRAPGSSAFALLTNSLSADGRSGAEDIVIRDLTFDSNGASQQPPYSEYRHAIALIGARGVSVTACGFRRLSGDGIYVGSTADGVHRVATPRQVRIVGCDFDGGGRGRNGISLIDAEDVLVTGSVFVNVAGPAMPGAVDLEPNRPTETITDVVISRNTFHRCRQGVQVYNAAEARVARILIRDNTIVESRDGGHGIFAVNVDSLSVIHNSIRNVPGTASGIQVDRSQGAAITHNLVTDVGGIGISLMRSPGLELAYNSVREIGADGIRLLRSPEALIRSNEVSSWGGTLPNGSSALRGGEGSTGVRVQGNTFLGDGKTGTTAVSADGTSTSWTMGSNAISGVAVSYDLTGGASASAR